jgi:hypothetical protein
MTTETKTKSEIARAARRDNAFDKLKSERSTIAKLEKEVDSAKSRLVKSAMTAKNNGATLKEIAEITGYSIGWVQQALVSIGYEPRAYNTSGSSNGKKSAK